MTPLSLEPRSRGLPLALRLEQGEIVRFPRCPFPLPPDDLAFLRQRAPAPPRGKNLSFHPETGAVRGLGGSRALRERAADILIHHSQSVQRFLWTEANSLALNWKAAACGFDAGPCGATHGDRVLRFFVNIHPSDTSVWTTRGRLKELLPRLARPAGLTRENFPRGLEETVPNRVLTAGLRAVARLGLPLDRVLDTSPYDRAMRRLRFLMTEHPRTPEDCAAEETLEFPPRSAWALFTDAVSLKRVSGEPALVSTFVIPRGNCALQELTPYRLIEEALRA